MQLAAVAWRRTLEERRLRGGFKLRLKEARSQRNAGVALARAWTQQQATADIGALRARQPAELDAVKRQQGKLIARFVTAIDVSGRTRRKRRPAVPAVGQRQSLERRELAARMLAALAIQAERERDRAALL